MGRGLAHARWRALGTGVQVTTIDGHQLAAASAAVAVELGLVDRACSRFRPDSELLALEAAGGRPMRLTPVLADALHVALEAARLTGGAVDPTIGSSIRALGWDSDFAAVRARTAPPRMRVERPRGWQCIRFDRVTRMASVPRGVHLDLGSTAKAWAADRCAQAAWAATGSGGVLVSLGGDIATAGAAPASGWDITVGDDHAALADVGDARIALHAGALATSSTSVRRWQTGGDEQQHHIIDPRTGRPANSPWRTVSVAARSCLAANTASTAAIVLGGDAPTWLHSIDVPARLVDVDGEVTLIGDWPATVVEVAS
jgi:thiamine biosynthesis lipoprotein